MLICEYLIVTFNIDLQTYSLLYLNEILISSHCMLDTAHNIYDTFTFFFYLNANQSIEIENNEL
jgi:hypothetical protein